MAPGKIYRKNLAWPLVLKIFWYKITGFVGRLFGRKPSQVVGEPQAEVQDKPEQQEGSQDG